MCCSAGAKKYKEVWAGPILLQHEGKCPWMFRSRPGPFDPPDRDEDEGGWLL